MKALLIVDVQNDFLPGGALAVAHGDEIIPFINELQKEFELVLATKDWHPKNHISFASRHNKKPGEKIPVKKRWQELWPDHCVQGSFGSEFSTPLNTEKIGQVFLKGSDSEIDSYSGFYDNERLRSTGLEEYLKAKGVTEVVIVGLTLEYCVTWTALDAKKAGFEVTVILKGCRALMAREGEKEKALLEMKRAKIRIQDLPLKKN